MVDPLDPEQLPFLASPDDSRSFAVKQIATVPFESTSLSVRKQAWADALEFLNSIRLVLFDKEALQETAEQRKLFTPQIRAPESHSPGVITLGLDDESKSGLRNQFLFIEDVYHFTWQIWQLSLNEETLLEKKRVNAASKSTSSESSEQMAWKSRADVLYAIKKYLLEDIKPLKEFEPYRFDEGRQRFTEKIEQELLELRALHSKGGPFRDSLDKLIRFAKDMAVESGLDVAELPEVVKNEEVPTAEVAEEKTDATIAAAGIAALTDDAPAPEASDVGGGEDDAGPRNTSQQPPRNRPPSPEEPPIRPSTVQDVELNNLKTITIETERLSRIFLYQLADQYGLPPELLQGDNSGFRDTIREDMRQWIVKKLKAGELDALYDPTAIRERQLLVARFGEVLSRDGRFDLFQKILLQHHRRLNTDPVQQAAFRDQLENGSFQNPDSWKSLLDNFANGMLDTTRDPQGQAAVNPKEHIATALKSSLLSLAHELNGLGLADLNRTDSPQLFEARVTTITTMIDVMVALRFAPIYLETLGREHFQETFKITVSEAEYRSLITVLQTYWDVRERSFTEQGINLNYVLEGLDVDELEDWIQNMSSTSRAEYYNRYLERLEYFAEIGHRVGGFHRVVLALAPRGAKTGPDGDAATDAELDPEEIKKFTAVTKAKLEVMRDSLSYAFSQLPDDAKRAVYNQIDPSQADEWLRTNYYPTEISFNDLDLIAQYANELGITSPVADDSITSAGGWTNDPTVGPMPNVANRAANTIQNVNNRYQQFQRIVAKKKKKVAKQAAKKAAQAATKATAEVGLNALGSAFGIPFLGTTLVNAWYAIPEPLRPVLGFLLVTAPLALVGGLAGFFLGLPNWFSGAGAGVGSIFKGLFNPKSASATASNVASVFQPGSGSGAAAGQLGGRAATQAVAGKSLASAVATGIHPAAQAILISTGVVGVSSLLNYMIVTNAFLANFPLPDEDKSINEKISKYVALEKTVIVPPPCDQATLKCPELSGDESYEVTYTIKLTLKGDYTISINKVKDEITAKFSKKKFEELGRPLPADIVITKVVIPSTETGSRSDFEELTPDPNDERNILRPGEELIITYVETYDSAFNNSQVRNIFNAEFFYVEGTNSGNDFVETAKSICIGDCSQEEGCWPATGFVYQGPWGRETHNLNNVGVDAYDISDPHKRASELQKLGVPMDKMSNPAKIYSPFVAQACYPPYSAVYGNYVVLTTSDWVYWLGHMVSRTQESGCQQVQPGDIVGIMGTTGASGGVHSHFELRTLDGAVTVGRPEDPLGEQMPPSLKNNKPPHAWVQNAAKPSSPWADADYVGSCYDMD